ncbi:PKD domain-containing protein [Flavobacterium supellecticarium]|uniref:PKD domain-containing protein n=1 Tax=Flavobacterium supellecticarium TaxID=2565924 RepID=A0A4S3ZS87_9FLAO|nr:PKD domain-containing protein [Flavobacterium supellecticarium]THF48517.1 PKD domain-containing protein [Flavobacterium supellecticarium]
MKKQYLTILIVLLIAIKGFAQSEPCLTDELMRNALKENPSIQNYLDEMDRTINQTQNQSSKLAASAMITIPVVVYIVHGGVNNPENISDNQVTSQITALNSYFNPHGINFCLATKAGNIAIPSSGGTQTTPGIVHLLSTALTDHDAQTEQQNLVNIAGTTISSNRYLRIWVVKSISNTGAAGTTLGYSMFPNTSPIFDGVVIRSDVFGSAQYCQNCNLMPNYNLGKTLVHEVGHFLGLYHTFHEGCTELNNSNCNLAGDRICDTPPTETANFLCINKDTCIEPNNQPDDIHNHMDYGDDNCSTHFSEGQRSRMFATLFTYRYELFDTDNSIYTGICNYQNMISATFSASNYAPCQGTTVTFSPTMTGSNITYLWNFGDPASGNNNTSTLQNPTHLFSSVSNSPYNVTLTINNGTSSSTSAKQIFNSLCQPIQNEDNSWYFSTYNGLNFNTGTPLYNSSIPFTNTMQEACSVQNDPSGNVLFYTNGINVWNKNHILINNSNSIKGDTSSASGAITVKNPANNNQYYIFTKGSDLTNNGFRYSIINNSNGVISMSSTVGQPITFPNGYLTGDNNSILGGEGVSAAQHCDGYWIVTSSRKSSGYFLVVYSLTSSGLSFINETALPTNITRNLSTIEFSPNGNKIAYINRAGTVLLFDFNKFTGAVSNMKSTSSNELYYSGSFSPDSALFYYGAGSKVYQINANAVNPNESRMTIFNGSATINGFQKGPDNKIYLSFTNSKLAVIHNPNIIATPDNANACNFTPNGPILQQSLSYALPNMVDAKIETAFNNTISHSASGCLTYKFNANVCTQTFSWNFGDSASGANNTSTLANPSHTFSSAGTYTVTLISGGNTITKTITVGMASANILGSTSACSTNSNATNNFVVLQEGQRAQWSITSGAGSINGLNNQSNVLVNWTSLPGTISVTVTDVNGCTSTATKTITANCNPTTNCDNDLVLNTTEATNTTHQVSNTITLNGNYTINSGVNVNLKAGNTIIFKPNSVVKSGANMLAKIENCPEQKTVFEDLKMAPETTIDQIRLYPNPTTSRIKIETSGAPMTEIAISSFEGKSIFIYKLKESTQLYQIDMSDLQNGIYFLTIKSSTGELVTKKIIKQ